MLVFGSGSKSDLDENRDSVWAWGREPATVKGPAVPTIYDLFGPPREPRDAGRTSLREFLYPQIGRPLCRVFALAADTWPERVIAADLLHE
jgi:hypothetical protein